MYLIAIYKYRRMFLRSSSFILATISCPLPLSLSLFLCLCFYFYSVHNYTLANIRLTSDEQRHSIVLLRRWVAFIGMGGCNDTAAPLLTTRTSHYFITINNRTANRPSTLLHRLLGTLFRRLDQHS